MPVRYRLLIIMDRVHSSWYFWVSIGKSHWDHILWRSIYSMIIHYGQDHLTRFDSIKLARKEIKGIFHPEFQKKVSQSAQAVAAISERRSAQCIGIYRICPLCTTRTRVDTRTFKKISKKSAVGLGDPIPEGDFKWCWFFENFMLGSGFRTNGNH